MLHLCEQQKRTKLTVGTLLRYGSAEDEIPLLIRVDRKREREVNVQPRTTHHKKYDVNSRIPPEHSM